jgi:hypothetical protein
VCVCVCVHPIHSAEYSSSALREESKSCYSIKVRSRETCQCCFIPEILGIDGCRGMGSLLGEDGPFSSYPAGPLWNSLSRHTKLGGDTNVISFFFPFFFWFSFCVTPLVSSSPRSRVCVYISSSYMLVRNLVVQVLSSTFRHEIGSPFINVNEADGRLPAAPDL